MYIKIGNNHFSDELNNVPIDDLKTGDLISLDRDDELYLMSLSSIKNKILYQFKCMSIENNKSYISDEDEDEDEDEELENNEDKIVTETYLYSNKETTENYLLLPNGKFYDTEENYRDIYYINKDRFFEETELNYPSIIEECRSVEDFKGFKVISRNRLYHTFCLKYGEITLCFTIESKINVERLMWNNYYKLEIIDFKSEKMVSMSFNSSKYRALLNKIIPFFNSEKLNEEYGEFEKFYKMLNVDVNSYLSFSNERKISYEKTLSEIFNNDFYPFNEIIKFYQPFHTNGNLKFYLDLNTTNIMIYRDGKHLWGLKGESQETIDEYHIALTIRNFKQSDKNGISPYDGEYYKCGEKRDDYVVEYDDFGGKIVKFSRMGYKYLCKSGEYYFELENWGDQRVRDLSDRQNVVKKLIES